MGLRTEAVVQRQASAIFVVSIALVAWYVWLNTDRLMRRSDRSAGGVSCSTGLLGSVAPGVRRCRHGGIAGRRLRLLPSGGSTPRESPTLLEQLPVHQVRRLHPSGRCSTAVWRASCRAW